MERLWCMWVFKNILWHNLNLGAHIFKNIYETSKNFFSPVDSTSLNWCSLYDLASPTPTKVPHLEPKLEKHRFAKLPTTNMCPGRNF